MVLGAGIYQLPLISLASEMDFETIVVSPRGDYPGIPLSDVHLDTDTRDIERIVNAAGEYGISGIVTTGTDAGVPAMGSVVDAMGLKGPSSRAAETASLKTVFRAFQEENRFNHPSYQVCSCSGDVWAFLQKAKRKIVVKPDDSSGSRGVGVVDPAATREMVDQAYRNATVFSRNGRICVESYVEGFNFGGAAFLSDGDFSFFSPTRKHMAGSLVQGHSFPSGLCEDEISVLKKEVLDTVLKLGYLNGPLDFDAVLSGREVTVLEVGLRLGGNGIVDCIKHGTGIDLLEWILIYATGGEVSAPDTCEPEKTSSYVFGTSCSGRLSGVPELEVLKKDVPELIKLVLARKPGDYVQPFIHNANLVGYFMLRCGENSYREVVAKLNNSFQLNFEEASVP